MNHHPQAGVPGAAMYPRGGPGGVGPMHKVNIRCRFYSKTSNKCTWGDHCRFEHRDDSPGPEFDNRQQPLPPPAAGSGPSSSRGPPPPPPMGAAERGSPYPPYPGASRHQPYPQAPPAPHGYPYEAPYGHHHSTPPPLPQHWRQQHSPHPHPSPSSGNFPPPPTSGGPSSSAVVYERKHRLAYELAPWNDRGYPPPSRYDRGDPPGGRGFYSRGPPVGSREAPYGREPPMGPHHMGAGGPYPNYQNYPSAYRSGGPPMGPHASHYKFMSSSQRSMPPDSRRSRTNKRGHDEDESSWSDSGSEDSILGQANYSNKCHATKASKQQQQQPTENAASDEPLDQGSGTPPGEPLPEDRERQEILLNKLKEIEDLMAKKKGEQEDPM